MYPHRQRGYNVTVVSEWVDPEEDDANLAWTKETFRALSPFTVDAVYVNYLADDETVRVPSAHGPNWERLVQLKRRVDPDNFFHMNQNVDPTADLPAR